MYAFRTRSGRTDTTVLLNSTDETIPSYHPLIVTYKRRKVRDMKIIRSENNYFYFIPLR